MVSVFSYAVACRQEIGARNAQEDYFSLPPEEEEEEQRGLLYIVSDGMGGHSGGATASVMAVRHFRNAYSRVSPGAGIPNALLSGTYAANDAVVAAGRAEPGPRRMGATLIAACIHNQQLYWSSVGDSRLYLVRNGSLAVMNRSHTYGDELLEKVGRGEITLQQAENDSDREALVSFIGIDPLTKVDCPFQGFPLNPGDTIVMATDGLFKFLPDEDIRDVLNSTPNVHLACAALTDAVLERRNPSQDNVTVILIRVVKKRVLTKAARRFAKLALAGFAGLLVAGGVFYSGMLVGKSHPGAQLPATVETNIPDPAKDATPAPSAPEVSPAAQENKGQPESNTADAEVKTPEAPAQDGRADVPPPPLTSESFEKAKKLDSKGPNGSVTKSTGEEERGPAEERTKDKGLTNTPPPQRQQGAGKDESESTPQADAQKGKEEATVRGKGESKPGDEPPGDSAK